MGAPGMKAKPSRTARPGMRGPNGTSPAYSNRSHPWVAAAAGERQIDTMISCGGGLDCEARRDALARSQGGSAKRTHTGDWVRVALPNRTTRYP
jgi:hypothetical protein